jgi:putative ABC transport system ATP-binding protein
MNRVMVQTEGLTKTYLKGRIVALEEVNLWVEKGEFVSILGPSGSGKTTLLNMIGALDNSTRGKVFVEGVDLSRVTNLNRFRAEKVGFIFQLHNLIPTLNAYENVQLPMYAIKINSKQRRQRAVELLEAVGLKDRLYHTPAMLSGGERQRVAIARALANNPPLILGDEPTGTLDTVIGEEIIELMFQLNRKAGSTLIIVTHDIKVAKKANRVIHLNNGRISG